MIIIFLEADVKSYQEKFLELLEKADKHCRICRSECNRHGYYERYVVEGQRTITIKILRVKCKGCRKTHAVIPGFLRPYSPYLQMIREASIRLLQEGVSQAETARRTGLSRELIRWWQKTFERGAPEVTLAIQSMFHETVIEAAKTCWERLKSLVEKLGNMVGTVLMQANILANQSGLRVWV